MSALATAVGDYIDMRRSVGFKLDEAARLLPRFVSYLEARGETRITVASALAFAGRQTGRGPASCLTIVRGFARYMAAIDPTHEVPPTGLIRQGRWRPFPYLYCEEEIVAIMSAARSLKPELWAATCQTAIGLLWASGMRVSEVLTLQRADVSLETGIISIHMTKFGKSRHIPLEHSSTDALVAYDALRDRLSPSPAAKTFFVSASGSKVCYERFRAQFANLLGDAGVPFRATAKCPRIHDLRHSFAVRTLLRWYRQGEDVQALLPRLSTYLGHGEPRATYWYLSNTPELMALVAQRLEIGEENS